MLNNRDEVSHYQRFHFEHQSIERIHSPVFTPSGTLLLRVNTK